MRSARRRRLWLMNLRSIVAVSAVALALGVIACAPQENAADNDVIAVVEDGAGTIMVKRYRLVLPGER